MAYTPSSLPRSRPVRHRAATARLVACAALLGLAAACVTPPEGSPLEQSRPKQSPPEQSPPEQSQCPEPWATDEDGALVHLLTGVSFAPRIGPFTRGKSHVYDDCGKDVSVAYALRDQREPIIVTTYVGIGLASDAKSYFDDSERSLAMVHGDAQRGATGPFDFVAAGHTVSGFFGIYRFANSSGGFGGDDGMIVQSELYVFVEGEVAIKYRISYPATVAEAAHGRVEALINGFDWQALF